MHVEQALERYGPLVMSLIWRINQNREETADLYQEVFLKYHVTTSEAGPLQQPKSWLCRTAINAAIDFGRQRARLCPWTEPAQEPHSREVEDAVERRLMVEAIRRLALDLPERRREVFILRYFQGCSFEQIARILDCSEGAARAAAFQAARQIRERLSADMSRETPNLEKEACR